MLPESHRLIVICLDDTGVSFHRFFTHSLLFARTLYRATATFVHRPGAHFYTFEIIKDRRCDPDDLTKVLDFVREICPSARLVREHGTNPKIEISSEADEVYLAMHLSDI